MEGPRRLLLLPLILVSLYTFTCSLSLLSRSFRLLSSQGSFLAAAEVTNPVLALALGILATTLVQSSSAVTSLVVAMVAASTITVEQGIPVIMGANIGTSLTSTVVALYNIDKQDEYKRGFSAAILTDLFNWMTVMVLFPVELATGLLGRLSGLLVDSIFLGTLPSSSSNPLSFLDAILDPLVDSVVVLKPPAMDTCGTTNTSLTLPPPLLVDRGDRGDKGESEEEMEDSSEEDASSEAQYKYDDGEEDLESSEEVNNTVRRCSILETDCSGGCRYLFAATDLSDEAVGGIVLLLTLVIFVLSFAFMMRSQKTLMGSLDCFEKPLQVLPTFARDLLHLVCGFLLTILVHSSSAVTSIVVALASQDSISLERAYAVVVGANFGTTATSVIAALSTGQGTRFALQLAFCHCIFNVSGFILFFIFPFMRWPLFVARRFGSKVDQYKWFSVFYLLMSFVLIPSIIYGLSLINTVLLYLITATSSVLVASCVLITIMQDSPRWKKHLPYKLRDWSFIPKHFRSFHIIDYVVQTYMEVFCCCVVERSVMLRLEGRAEEVKGSNVLQLGLGANLQLKVKVEG